MIMPEDDDETAEWEDDDGDEDRRKRSLWALILPDPKERVDSGDMKGCVVQGFLPEEHELEVTIDKRRKIELLK